MAKSILASLTVVDVVATKPVVDKLEIARSNLIAAIDTNIQAATALSEKKSFVVRKPRFVEKPTADGTGTERVKEEMPLKKWRPFFFEADGAYYVTLRYGFTSLNLGKGHSVKAGKIGDVPKVLEQLKKAVEAGELDEALKAAAGARKARKKKD